MECWLRWRGNRWDKNTRGGGGDSWLVGIMQELEKSNIKDILENGKNNDYNIWKGISKKCVNIERQSVDVEMRKVSSPTLY